MTIERRFMHQPELRAEEGEETSKIIGYGSVFNLRSENLGGFREIIAPGAFDSVLDDDVRALFNHDSNFVLGRSKAGTLKLSTDPVGLRYEIDAPTTQTIRDLVIAPMKRGDIDQSSFGFSVARGGEEWDEDDEGVIVRTITKVQRLYDVSPVTYPAYPDASAATRNFEAFMKEHGQEGLQRALNQKAARERFLTIINS